MEKIVLIGAGNVGFHLGKRLFEKGHSVVQVFSRSLSKAQELAKIIHSEPCHQLSKVRQDGTLYILAVSDDALVPIAKTLASILPQKALVVHTSGATPATIFGEYFTHYGVFYPLQTFSRNRTVDFAKIPICIDAADAIDLRRLELLAQSISSVVHPINDHQRAVLHVAAVFVNNFTNHLLGIGHDIVTKENIPFSLLMPLLDETVAKVKDNPPWDMQTGPAVRGDEETIKRHLHFLERYPAYQALYQQLSEGIQKSKP